MNLHVLLGYITVFVGAGLGGLLRHAANRTGAHLSLTFPWSTLCVNISGCFIMGLIAGWFAFRGQASQSLRLFLTTGILGGYTTFSAFSLDAALLWERGDVRGCVFYVASSVFVSLVAVFAGLYLMRHWPA